MCLPPFLRRVRSHSAYSGQRRPQGAQDVPAAVPVLCSHFDESRLRQHHCRRRQALVVQEAPEEARYCYCCAPPSSLSSAKGGLLTCWAAPALFEAKRRQVADNGAINEDTEAGLKTRDHPDEATQATPSASKTADPRGTVATQARDATSTESEAEDEAPPSRKGNTAPENPKRPEVEQVQEPEKSPLPQTTRIKFDANVDAHPKNDVTLYIPGPRDRDRGDPLIELDRKYSVSRDRSIHDRDLDAITPVLSASRPSLRRRRIDGLRLVEAKSLDRVATVASSVFVLGGEKKPPERRPSVSSQSQPALNDKPFLSRQVTIGRNSQFQNMTSEDRDALGGIEYRSLKLLLKIVLGESKPIGVLERLILTLCSLLLWPPSLWCHLPRPLDQTRRSQVSRIPSRDCPRRRVVVSSCVLTYMPVYTCTQDLR